MVKNPPCNAGDSDLMGIRRQPHFVGVRIEDQGSIWLCQGHTASRRQGLDGNWVPGSPKPMFFCVEGWQLPGDPDPSPYPTPHLPPSTAFASQETRRSVKVVARNPRHTGNSVQLQPLLPGGSALGSDLKSAA